MPYFEFCRPTELSYHLAEHDVSPEEFQEVVSRPERHGQSRSTGRPCCWERRQMAATSLAFTTTSTTFASFRLPLTKSDARVNRRRRGDGL